MSWTPLWLSFQIACLATLLTFVVGTGLALLLRWDKLPARDLVDAVISTPLVLPPTVLGYYLLVVLGNGSVIGESWEWLTGRPIVFHFTGAVIAAAVGSLPLVVRATKIGLDAVDPNVVNAARTLGARPLRVLVTVLLPLAGPGIVAGAMMGFARSLGDFGATYMVASARPLPDRIPTASIYIYDEMMAGRDDNVFAMSLALTFVGVAMMYFANRLTNRLQHARP